MYQGMTDSLAQARAVLLTAGVGWPAEADAPDPSLLCGERLVAAIADDLLRVSIYLSKSCSGVEHGVSMFLRLAATAAAAADHVCASNASGYPIASGVRSWSPTGDVDDGAPVYRVEFYVPMVDASPSVCVRLSLLVDEDRMLAVDVGMPNSSRRDPDAVAAIRAWMAAGLAVELEIAPDT